MERAVLSGGRASLILYDPIRTAGGAAEYLSIAVEGPDLRAARQVYEGWEVGFENLARFFAELMDNWRGWHGARNYQSMEGDFQIVATHDGHVNLGLLLWESTEPTGWRVETTLRLNAGEQLSRAAADIAELVGAQ